MESKLCWIAGVTSGGPAGYSMLAESPGGVISTWIRNKLKNARPIVLRDLPLIQRTNEELSHVDGLFKEAAAALELPYQAESKAGASTPRPPPSPAARSDLKANPTSSSAVAAELEHLHEIQPASDAFAAVRRCRARVPHRISAQAEAALIPVLAEDFIGHVILPFGRRVPGPSSNRYGLELVDRELQMQKQEGAETELQEMERGGFGYFYDFQVALLVLVYPLAFLVPPRAPARAATLSAGVAAGTPLAAWAQDAGDDFGSATTVVEVLFAAATIAIILNPDYFLGGKWVKAVQGATCEVSHILLEDEKSAAEVFAQCQGKNFNDFKRLARKKSLDGATAVRGGDLGAALKSKGVAV
ncbi:unnamed protein product [Symbiodinium sp. CCMP2592]|nr:unnamed protein product [Symbiodinium sp. CCMP2592]